MSLRALFRLRNLWPVFLCGVCGGLTIGLGLSSIAHAQGRLQLPPRAAETPIGFSTLVVRLESEDVIGFANEQYRVLIVEQLRKWGLRGVGVENLVFGHDDSAKAHFVLGGTIVEADCNRPTHAEACRIGIEWQLLDVARDEVVYRVTTRFGALHIRNVKAATIGNMLVLGALQRAVTRSRFLAILAASHDDHSTDLPNYASATYRECDAGPVAMPSGAESAMAATVIIESNESMGSGFWLSPDGLVITAAHVVTSGALKVKTKSGDVYPAQLVRIARARDSALLRVRLPSGTSTPCLPTSRDEVPVGTEIYVVGTPVAKALSFSVSRGIASGMRDFDGRRYMQTDAAVNSGNSGGPMVAGDGRVVAIASWKVARAATEGLSFGVPMSTVLDALALKGDATTAPALLFGRPKEGAVNARSTGIVDTADPFVSLDPEGDARRKQRALQRKQDAREAAAEAARDEERDRKLAEITPTYIPVMRWTGVGVAAAGVASIVATTVAYDSSSSTHSDYERLRTYNDIGWVAVIAGAAAFGLSWYLQPRLPETNATSRSKPALRATARGLRVDF